MPRTIARHIRATVLALFAMLPICGQAAAAVANADSYIVVDAASGRVLSAKNPDARLFPASMTKIMTLYLTFEALSQGRLSLNTPLQVSELASEQAPSKLGLRPGSRVSTETCILAAVTLSANDCAMVLAENIGGNEDEFARLMTSRAKSLGMDNTHFDNPNGLPDEGQLTTARDMATLAEALIQRFPKYYRYFATRSFTYNGIAHPNHNHLMSRYPGMDGIKTGFIRASGFNLTASAVRDKHRLIAVVFGGVSAVSRDNYMAALLDDGFRKIAGQPGQPELTAGDMGVPPPEKPVAEAATGQVAGVALAEAGDAVESGEGAPAAAAAIVAEPVQPAQPAVQVAGNAGTKPNDDSSIAIPAKMLEEPVEAAGQAKPAAADVGPANPAPAAAGSMPTPPGKPAQPAVIAQGDADNQPEPAHVLRLPSHGASAKWGVQLGTYSSRVVSDAMLQKAVATLPKDIKGMARPVSVPIHYRHGKVYRAELTGMNQIAAKKACTVLAHCIPLRT